MMEEKITRWGGLTYDLPSIYSEEVVMEKWIKLFTSLVEK